MLGIYFVLISSQSISTLNPTDKIYMSAKVHSANSSKHNVNITKLQRVLMLLIISADKKKFLFCLLDKINIYLVSGERGR